MQLVCHLNFASPAVPPPSPLLPPSCFPNISSKGPIMIKLKNCLKLLRHGLTSWNFLGPRSCWKAKRERERERERELFLWVGELKGGGLWNTAKFWVYLEPMVSSGRVLPLVHSRGGMAEDNHLKRCHSQLKAWGGEEQWFKREPEQKDARTCKVV